MAIKLIIIIFIVVINYDVSEYTKMGKDAPLAKDAPPSVTSKP
jgi:hypothetical protein